LTIINTALALPMQAEFLLGKAICEISGAKVTVKDAAKRFGHLRTHFMPC
jgi:hypothetical protein